MNFLAVTVLPQVPCLAYKHSQPHRQVIGPQATFTMHVQHTWLGGEWSRLRGRPAEYYAPRLITARCLVNRSRQDFGGFISRYGHLGVKEGPKWTGFIIQGWSLFLSGSGLVTPDYGLPKLSSDRHGPITDNA